jgi:hypothetical protein
MSTINISPRSRDRLELGSVDYWFVAVIIILPPCYGAEKSFPDKNDLNYERKVVVT